jgi:hypothetical protein
LLLIAPIKNEAWNTAAHASAIQKLRSRVFDDEPQRTEPAVVRSAVSPILSVLIPQLDPNGQNFTTVGAPRTRNDKSAAKKRRATPVYRVCMRFEVAFME